MQLRRRRSERAPAMRVLFSFAFMSLGDARLGGVSPDDAYALGLWCADDYWWSSSIGLPKTDPELISASAAFLSREVGPDRLHLRVYQVAGDEASEQVLALRSSITLRPPVKMKRTAYHIYVNSRPLFRLKKLRRTEVGALDTSLIGPYVAGRVDGDGSFGNPRAPGTRISYSGHEGADVDAWLLARQGITTSIFRYAAAVSSAHTFMQHVSPVSGTSSKGGPRNSRVSRSILRLSPVGDLGCAARKRASPDRHDRRWL